MIQWIDTPKRYVIFSIDNFTNVHTLAKFLSFWDKNRAMCYISGSKMAPVIGSYEGFLEYSFITTYEDFSDLILPSGYVEYQREFIVIEEGHKGVLVASDYNSGAILGTVVNVTKSEAFASDGWTYRPDTDTYAVIKPLH